MRAEEEHNSGTSLCFDPSPVCYQQGMDYHGNDCKRRGLCMKLLGELQLCDNVADMLLSTYHPRASAYLKALDDVDDRWLKNEPHVALFSVIHRQFSKPTSNAWQQSLPPEMIRSFMTTRDYVQGLDREQHLARKLKVHSYSDA